ncbi:MAG: adenosylcobinamide amidohydrolase [Chloroflexota bacterium]
MNISDLKFPNVHTTLDDRALHVASARDLAVLSSAIVGTDLDTTRHILNMHVHKGYCCDKPEDDLRALARELGITENFVGLLTAVKLERARGAVAQSGALTVAALVTLGLSNPMAAGISAPAMLDVGTINMILLIDGNLTRAAQVNAVITATEAKTLVLIESGVKTRDGSPTTGTSTDAVVVACTGRGERLPYAGTATEIGWLIGRSVRDAVLECLQLTR